MYKVLQALLAVLFISAQSIEITGETEYSQPVKKLTFWDYDRWIEDDDSTCKVVVFSNDRCRACRRFKPVFDSVVRQNRGVRFG